MSKGAADKFSLFSKGIVIMAPPFTERLALSQHNAKCFVLNPHNHPIGGSYNYPHFIDEESLSLSKDD